MTTTINANAMISMSRRKASLARLRSVWRSTRGLLRTLLAERAVRRAVAALGQVDDRMLSDIGLTRSDIAYAARHGRP
jgi:uncharacterized protein YjiS (DUF1127 family)